MNNIAKARQQKGVMILAITIVLLVVATIATLVVARVGVTEQKMVATDVRSKEVYAAAIGGLEYGVNWLSDIANAETVFWDNGCVNDTFTPTAPANTTLNADTYSHNVTYGLKSVCNPAGVPQMVIVEVASTATATGDSHVTKTVREDVILTLQSLIGGGDSIFQGPPLLVEGCILEGGPNGVSGNPDIYPGVTPGGSSVAIGTTTSSIDCLPHGHFDLHGGEKAALEPSSSLWNAVFGSSITKADLKAQAQAHPETIIFVDGAYPKTNGWNGNHWTRNVGSANAPVLLFFDASQGCPKLNGSVNIFGIVYFEDANCGDHGWGNGTITGTVAVAGDLAKFNANTEIIGVDFSDFMGGGSGPNDPWSKFIVAAVPGSWRDF